MAASYPAASSVAASYPAASYPAASFLAASFLVIVVPYLATSALSRAVTAASYLRLALVASSSADC